MYKIATLAFLLSITIDGKAQLPSIELQNALNGKWQSVETLKGEKLTIVDFWATWCKPCAAALPKLNKLSTDFKSKGVNFVGVNIDGPRNQSKVRPFIKTHKISYPVLKDPNSHLMQDVNANAVPTLLIFNSNGKLVYFHEGFTNGAEIEIKKKIEELLNKQNEN